MSDEKLKKGEVVDISRSKKEVTKIYRTSRERRESEGALFRKGSAVFQFDLSRQKKSPGLQGLPSRAIVD